MKSHPLIHLPLFAALAVSFLGFALVEHGTAQDANKPAAPGQPKPAAYELEAKFVATLTNATLTGRWCAIKDGQLGPDKDEQYTIASITKLSGDQWQISARLQYGGKSIDVPIPAQVQWAGDAPVLIVDHVSMGGPRTYSARVMFYEKTYAGTWSAGDHGGMLYGIIITNGKN